MASLADDPRFREQLVFLREFGIQSLCALPLTTVQRRVGVVGLASWRPDAYRAEDLGFLGLVGNLVAGTLDAALSFHKSRAADAEVRERNERLRLLLEINNTLVSNLEYRDLLQAISVNLRVLIKCDGIGVALHDTARDRLCIRVRHFPGGSTVFSEDDLLDEDSRGATAFRSGQPLCVVGQPDQPIVPFNGENVSFLTMIGGQIAIALENTAVYREIAELRDRLTSEKVFRR